MLCTWVMKKKMYMFLVVILFGVFKLSEAYQSYDYEKFMEYDNSKGVRERVESMVREHYRDCVERVKELMPMRFMYEESPHYEIGYIMGEIVERYKKMVFNVKRPRVYKQDNVFDTLRNVEWIQKYYFEIYHLINMIHEIEHKYKRNIEFADLSQPPNYKNIRLEEAKERQLQRILARKKKSRMKHMKKIQALLESGKIQEVRPKKTINKWWPIDYGWEIDYYW